MHLFTLTDVELAALAPLPVWTVAEALAARDGHPVMAPTALTPPTVGATHDREPA
jgi:hypothetical protein